MGCCIRDFPPDPGPPMTSERLRAYREIAAELTDGWHTKHSPGQLTVRQFDQFPAHSFLFNEQNQRVLWTAEWGNGPATEALSLAPHGLRDLIREVDRLTAENAELKIKLIATKYDV